MPLASIADLNGPEDEIIRRVNQAKRLSAMYDEFVVEDTDDKYRPPGIHASELYPCMRKSVYSLLDYPKNGRVPKFWKQKFKVGHALHKMMQDDFHKMAKHMAKQDALGLAREFAEKEGLVMEFQDEVPCGPEHQALAAHYNIQSSADGVFTFRERTTGLVVLRIGLEIKSEAPDGFKDLKAPKSEHVRQVHLYMACLDLPLMWFFYLNKGNNNNTNSEAPWLIHFQPAVWREVEARIQEVHGFAARNELPERVETIICEFCPWAHVCQPRALLNAQKAQKPLTLRVNR
jgi:hypothetical protein